MSFPYAGEDRELCDRWQHRGYRMIHAPEAVVYHSHHLTAKTFLLSIFIMGAPPTIIISFEPAGDSNGESRAARLLRQHAYPSVREDPVREGDWSFPVGYRCPSRQCGGFLLGTRKEKEEA